MCFQNVAQLATYHKQNSKTFFICNVKDYETKCERMLETYYNYLFLHLILHPCAKILAE